MSQSYVPRCRVTFRDLMTNEVIMDPSDRLLSVTVNKQYGAAAGTFTIALPWENAPGFSKRYDEVITPDDVVTIEMDPGDGTGFKFVLSGLVERPARAYQVDENGSPLRRINVTGKDFGKLLNRIELGWDISGINQLLFADGTRTIAAAVVRRILNQRGTSAEMMQWLFDIFQSQIPGAYYTKFYNLAPSQTDDTWVTYFPEMAGMRGTKAWAAMKRMENAPYNTLTTRTDPLSGTFMVILEKTPFDGTGRLDRGRLPVISQEEIKAENVGVGDHERVNLLCLWPPSYQAIANGVLDIALAFPDTTKINKASAQVHGFAPQVIQPSFVPKNFWLDASPDVVSTDLPEISKRADLFWAWFSKNDTYESGSFTTHLRLDIAEGWGFVHEEYGKEYFVEQVSHVMTLSPKVEALTHFQVTRGQKH